MKKTVFNLSLLKKRLLNSVQGFGVIELVIALSLLLIVLALSFTIYVFGAASFDVGEKQTDIQQNARMAAGFITEELRIAERVVLFDSYEDLPDIEDLEISDDYTLYFIYLKNSKIYFQKVDGENDPAPILEDISLKVEFDLEFSVSESRNILSFDITALEVASGRKYQLDTEVLVLNLEEIEDHSDGTGTALFYQIPAPPEQFIRRISLSPPHHTYGVYEGNENEGRINIDIITSNVEDGKDVTAEFWKVTPDDNYNISGDVNIDSSQVIEDDKANFNIAFGDDLHFGLYYVLVSVEGIEYSQKRYFYIYPTIDIAIDDRPGRPFYGVVEVEFGGVPEDTDVIFELIEITNSEDERLVEFTKHNEVKTYEDGKFESITFNLKLVHEEDFGKDFILKVTAGKLTESSEEFFVAEIQTIDVTETGAVSITTIGLSEGTEANFYIECEQGENVNFIIYEDDPEEPIEQPLYIDEEGNLNFNIKLEEPEKYSGEELTLFAEIDDLTGESNFTLTD